MDFTTTTTTSTTASAFVAPLAAQPFFNPAAVSVTKAPRSLATPTRRRSAAVRCISNADASSGSPPLYPPSSSSSSSSSTPSTPADASSVLDAPPEDSSSAYTSPTLEPEGTQGSSLGAIYKFTRPHTIRGTILASLAGCARALLEAPMGVIDWTLLPRAAIGLIALLFGNAYIVGINQIYDVKVDRINKPFLPLASRELSPKSAWAIVIGSGLLGLLFVKAYFSPLIFCLYAFGMVFGTLYSIPPFRFKRYPLLAAVTISCVRGFLLNFGVYHATKSALGLPFVWAPPITFLAVFMSVFATVIALAKDLPDIRGDRAGGIETFAASVGPHKLVAIVYAMLIVNYAGAVLTAGLAADGVFNRLALGGGHVALALWLISFMTSVRPGSQECVKKFYAFIWKLFYAEYLLFPFI